MILLYRLLKLKHTIPIMDSINKFLSFLGSDLSRLKWLPPELVGVRFGPRDNDFSGDSVTYLLKLSPYISYLHLGKNKKIDHLPDLPNVLRP